jgi:ABC-2 type transport system ATP-binding protein
MTTAYLDEAERCNRVGLMHRGRLIRCDAPAKLKSHMAEQCYEVVAPNQRAAREFLEKQPGIVSAEPSGSTLHLFLEPGITSADKLAAALNAKGLGPSEFHKISPSLEDVFIALIRKEEAIHA